MIASLSGVLELIDGQNVLIEVNGVGYKVLASSEVLAKAKVGEKIKLFIYTHVREDVLELYGFLQYEDLKLFEQLIGVSGIGPKTAMGVFSIGSSSDIMDAIVKGDTPFFAAVPRLGTKNAQKIIIELKGKLGSKQEFDLSGDGVGNEEVVAALRSFGFTQKEAVDAVRAVRGSGGTTEEKVKLALKYLGK